MRLGAALGVPGCFDLSSRAVRRANVRILALVTDAFGGSGGIAQYNRDLLSSLAACDRVSEVIILPRQGTPSDSALPPRLRQLRPTQGRGAYSLVALRVSQAHRPIQVVFCGHLFMAPLAA